MAMIVDKPSIRGLEVPGAGFEPAKQYAEELESTPFDHSGTPASC